MTISQKIVKSLQAANKESPLKQGEDDGIFDLDEHLKSVSKNILLERITFVEAKNSDHFDLKKLKSKYVVLNSKRSTEDQKMSPALKTTTQPTKELKHDGIPHPKTVLFSPDRVELSWKKAIRAGAGMANLGNTCFLNSSLQCLSYTAPLANYLINSDHRKHCVLNGQQFCMLCAMQQHLHHIHMNPGQAVKPMYILKNLRMIAKHLQFGRQEDAHEFIRYSVDAMQKSCLAGYSSKIDVHIKATTVVHQIFGGYLRSRVKCSQCKHVSDTYDPFLDLSLDINKQGCIDLQRCLEMFVHIEILQGDNAYKCIHCRTTVQACKKFSIHRAPNVLMMQLKRFSNFMGSKINKELSYPSKLNLGPYMSNKPEGGLWYELYAVLVHSGFSCQSGHYYTYAKAPNGQWYCFNDSSVHQVSINQVLNQQAYLLFYSRNSKSGHHIGNLKQSVNNNKHATASLHGKQFNAGRPAVIKDRPPSELRKALSKPIIGPQLPPNFKSQRSYTFQSTSSSSDTGSPVAKNLNEIRSKSAMSGAETSAVPSNRPPLQFNFNKKPKLKKLDTGNGHSKEGGFAHASNNGNFSVKSNSKKVTEGEKKMDRAPNGNANGPASTPILDKVTKTEGGAASSSATTTKKAASPSVKLATSSALTSLASYSSDEDDENTDEDKQSKESSSSSSALYSSISSTLKQLRKSVTKAQQNGDTCAEATSRSSASASAGKSSRDQNNNKIAGNSESNSAEKKTSAASGQKSTEGDSVRSPKASISVQAKREDFLNPMAAMHSLSTHKSAAADITPPTIKSSSLRKLLSGPQPEREPILDVLINEINSNDSRTCAPIAKAETDDISAPGTPDSESFRRKKHKLPQERGWHRHKKERKRHYSSESDGSSSETNKKKKHSKLTSSHHHSSCSSLPLTTDREHSLTPLKKRKRDKTCSRSREDVSSRKQSKDKREWQSNTSSSGNTDTDSANLSPKKKKKHDCVDSRDFKDRKRVHSNGNSKRNGRTDDTDKYSSVDDLYCESTQYEEIRKRKEREERKRAMKEKKKRMKERRMLQHSIDEDGAHSTDSTGQHERSKTDSTKCSEKSHSKSSVHSDDTSLNSRCDTTESPMKKNSHPLDGNLPRTQLCSFESAGAKERPNILAQLLKQSSGKAYGSKVKTWNGDDSLVEKDARETWKEQKAPLLDEWDREHDREKTKKIRRKHSEEKPGRISNLFQRFQNMKNQKWGGV